MRSDSKTAQISEQRLELPLVDPEVNSLQYFINHTIYILPRSASTAVQIQPDCCDTAEKECFLFQHKKFSCRQPW